MSQRWWEQAGIDLEGVKKRATEAVTVSELEAKSEAEADLESNEDSCVDKESKGASGPSGAEWSSAYE